jgi:hypothetical protein
MGSTIGILAQLVERWSHKYDLVRHQSNPKVVSSSLTCPIYFCLLMASPAFLNRWLSCRRSIPGYVASVVPQLSSAQLSLAAFPLFSIYLPACAATPDIEMNQSHNAQRHHDQVPGSLLHPNFTLPE